MGSIMPLGKMGNEGRSTDRVDNRLVTGRDSGLSHCIRERSTKGEQPQKRCGANLVKSWNSLASKGS